MKKVISIDPAIKHLATVTMNINEGEVSNLECKLIDLCNGKKAKEVKFEAMMNNLLDVLGTINMENVDIVLIENTFMNVSVKSIGVAIYTYYKMKNFEVHFVSPSRKLSKEENKLPYKERKKASVNKALSLLNDDDKAKVQAYKKQDDITDCIIQCLSYFN